jgi:hypothetical protein
MKKNRQTGDKVAVQYVDVPDEELIQMGVIL